MKKQTEQPEVQKLNPRIVFGFALIAALFVCPCLGQDYAYVSNEGESGSATPSNVTVIDLATNQVVTTVTVGKYPQGIAVNPAGTAVYVANTESNDVTVIDTSSYQATTIPAGWAACGLAVHPNGRHIYVANADFSQKGVSNVMVIDRATNKLVDTIDCGLGSVGVTVLPDGSAAYVANIWGGTVAVFDTTTHKVTNTIALKPVGAEEMCLPVPILVHPEGAYVYVANRLGPSVWAVNTATHEVITVPSGHTHVGLGINPAGTLLYVPDFSDLDMSVPPKGTSVEVLDARTLKHVTTIEGLNVPLEVSVMPDGTRICITNWGNNTISVHDATTYAVLATIPGGSHPNAFGEFIGPGVPRLLLQKATTRLQAVKATIAGGAEGVNSPQKALEHVDMALTSGNACLQENLWSATDKKGDPRRVQRAQGSAVFASEQTMVQAILDAIRLGWIVNAKLETELLAIVNEVIRANRVLAAVVIDDAIMAKADSTSLDKAQKLLQDADALAKEAAVWPQLDKKAALFDEAIAGYREAWDAAVKLVP